MFIVCYRDVWAIRGSCSAGTMFRSAVVFYVLIYIYVFFCMVVTDGWHWTDLSKGFKNSVKAVASLVV